MKSKSATKNKGCLADCVCNLPLKEERISCLKRSNSILGLAYYIFILHSCLGFFKFLYCFSTLSVLCCISLIHFSLSSPPSGWFYDWTQEYDTAFYFSGFCVLLGGFLLLLAALPCWNACTNQSSKLPPNTYSYKVASNA